MTTVRAASAADHTAVDALLAQCLAAHDLEDQRGLREVLWRDEENTRSFVAAVGERCIGAIVASVGTEPDGTTSGFVKVIAVDPTARRNRIGHALLAAAEHYCRSRGAGDLWTGGSQPHYWWPGVDEIDYRDALAFFIAAGYSEREQAPNLDVDLRALPPPPTPSGVRITRLTGDEWPAFAAWMATSWTPAWRDEVQLALTRDPVSCHVATIEGEYAGFAAYDTNRQGWFGPMGSTARGRGVGAATLLACLHDYRAAGRDHCEIAWIGPEAFYRRAVGAQLGRRFQRLCRTLDRAPLR